MAFGRNPSFLKRQKEQQRVARAARKREERLARKHAKGNTPGDGIEPLESVDGGLDAGSGEERDPAGDADEGNRSADEGSRPAGE